MMKCIIVDDEKLALDLLENNVARVPFLQLARRCKSSLEAITYLNNNETDLVFLDIQMPGITGIELLQSIRHRPQVIMVSAYEQYAVEGFNLDVTDYLVKPVSFERFLKACNKAWRVYQQQQSGVAAPDREYFFVNVEYRQVKITYDHITYIEAMRDYVRIHLHHEKPVITHMSMKAIEEKLNGHQFLRIHKSYIINVNLIKAIKRGIVIVEQTEVPFSDQYRDALNKKLGIGVD